MEGEEFGMMHEKISHTHTIQLTAALIIHFPLRLYSCNIALVHFAMTYFYSCQSIPSHAHLSACQPLDPCRNPAQRCAAV